MSGNIFSPASASTSAPTADCSQRHFHQSHACNTGMRQRSECAPSTWTNLSLVMKFVEHHEQIIGGEAAIIWGRERADVVLIRLGHSGDTYFSAGEHRAHKESMPLWPPRKPPPEGWYQPRPNEPSDAELTDDVHARDNVGSVAPMIWAQGLHLPDDV